MSDAPTGPAQAELHKAYRVTAANMAAFHKEMEALIDRGAKAGLVATVIPYTESQRMGGYGLHIQCYPHFHLRKHLEKLEQAAFAEAEAAKGAAS